MKQNLSKIYTIVVVLALLVLGGWSAWDVYRLRTSNSEAAMVNVEQIKSQIEDSYNSAQSFTDDSFFRAVRQLFKDNPDLELLTLYSHDPDVGIEYHYSRGEEVELLNFTETTPLTMKDLPDYKYNQLMKSKITSSLNASERSGMELDLIYKVVDSTTIYNILIRLLIVVVVLFFTTLFMIFTVSRRNQAKEENEDFDEDSPEMDQSFDDSDTEDDLSLDWDQNAPQQESEFSLDDSDFDSLDSGLSEDDFDDLNLDEATDDFSFDDADDDIAPAFEPESDLSEELSMEPVDDDFNFDDVTDDFGSDLGEELNLDEPAPEMETNEIDDFNLDETDDDMSFDDLDSFNLDSDIPEEEDLMAMDHEVAPLDDFTDDMDFENIEDTFSDNEQNADEEGPSLFSPKSGVGWEDFIEERVNFELERAASDDKDLVMGLVQCDSLNEDNYRDFADQLKMDFNYPDLIFEYKENGFALIVPNNDLDQALRTLESFTGKERENYGDINVGISSRNGRLITGGRIFMEAENALHKAIEDPEKNIVGFRSDPDKFRDFLSKK